jgi:hypothetical protein
MFGGLAAKVNGQMFAVMVEPDELRAWMRKALDFTASLPAKGKSLAKNAAGKKPPPKPRAPKAAVARKSKRKATSR